MDSMEIEYGSYRWVDTDLSKITVEVVKGINRVNRLFSIAGFIVPSMFELKKVWMLNQNPLSLGRDRFEEYDLLVFGPHTYDDERDERGRPKMYSPEVTLYGSRIRRMSGGFRMNIEDEMGILARTYSLEFNRKMLSVSFPPDLYAVKAKIFLL